MKRILSASVLCLFTTCVTAANAIVYKDAPIANDNGWFVGLGGGLAWNHFDESSTTVPNGSGATPPMNNDLYSIHTPSNTGIEQLSVGYRWHQEKKWLPFYHVYFQYRHGNSVDVNGTIEQYSLPEFLNYNYSLNYTTDLYTINGKFDLIQENRIMPYVAVGAGFIVTHLTNYTESAISPVTARISPSYQGGTNTSLALTAGVGVDFILTKNTWLTLGYDHLFQGHASTEQGSSTWSGTKLSLGNVRADTVFLNISAKIPDAFLYNA